jgi:hypothetical protein
MTHITATIRTNRGNDVKFVSMQDAPNQYWVYLNGELKFSYAYVNIQQEGVIMMTVTKKDGTRVEKWIEFDPNFRVRKL